MKVLIGYDGSPSADAALEELKRAGLPGNTKILLAAVGDIRIPLNLTALPSAALNLRRFSTNAAQLQDKAKQILMESEHFTGKAAARIKSAFPDWRVETAIMSGDAAPAIIGKAAEWNADLIVVGSQNRSAFGRFFLGSVSQKIVAQARCSVRVARAAAEYEKSVPHRIVAGVDSSEGVHALVKTLASREWAAGSSVMLVTATIGGFATAGAEPEREKIKARELQKSAKLMLRRLGLKVLTATKDGNVTNVLIAVAGYLNADCIFVSSRNVQGVLNRFILGSASTDVATNAPCSVEVIR